MPKKKPSPKIIIEFIEISEKEKWLNFVEQILKFEKVKNQKKKLKIKIKKINHYIN